MDLGLSNDVEESFRIFQGRILAEYDRMAQEMGFHIIDATQSIEDQQRQMRAIVMRELGRSLEKSVLRVPVPFGRDAAGLTLIEKKAPQAERGSARNRKAGAA